MQGIYLAFSDYSQIIENSLDYRDTVGPPTRVSKCSSRDYYKIIPGLLTMRKWLDQEKNRTSGHCFCRTFRSCGPKCKTKILRHSPFFMTLRLFVIIWRLLQDYSMIIEHFYDYSHEFKLTILVSFLPAIIRNCRKEGRKEGEKGHI